MKYKCKPRQSGPRRKHQVTLINSKTFFHPHVPAEWILFCTDWHTRCLYTGTYSATSFHSKVLQTTRDLNSVISNKISITVFLVAHNWGIYFFPSIHYVHSTFPLYKEKKPEELKKNPITDLEFQLWKNTHSYIYITILMRKL